MCGCVCSKGRKGASVTEPIEIMLTVKWKSVLYGCVCSKDADRGTVTI